MTESEDPVAALMCSGVVREERGVRASVSEAAAASVGWPNPSIGIGEEKHLFPSGAKLRAIFLFDIIILLEWACVALGFKK
jgi:hypothetical protein